jgi:predicted transcriptional regulator
MGSAARLAGEAAVPELGDLETRVMRKVWDRGGPVTVRDIVGDMADERPVAYTTVMTVMDNLRRKGWLRRRADGRAYRYEAVISAQEYGAGLIRQALAASSDRAGVLLQFIGELSADEADAVAEAYQRLTGETGP